MIIFNEATGRRKARRLELIAAVFLLCVLLVPMLSLCACGESSEARAEQSAETLTPYLEALGEWNRGRALALTSEQKTDMKHVELMGVIGSIEYREKANIGYIKSGELPRSAKEKAKCMEWVSFSEMTEGEYEQFAEKLKFLFGSSPRIEKATYKSDGELKKTQIYYWEENDLPDGLTTGTIIFFHGVGRYEANGQARIIFDLSEDPRPLL